MSAAKLPDAETFVAAVDAALDAGDTTAAEALIEANDRAIREAVAALDLGDEAGRADALALQHRQVEIVEQLRQRRDALAGNLQGMNQGRQARRAYTSNR
ncbi:MAG TPA: hypothetical protein VFY12_00170 [Arenimonas sp.]|nr:hypothetical protein [Arenimonas sp.]